MKKYLLFMLLTLCLTDLTAQSGEKNFIDQNYIEVNGKAEQLVTPDEIYMQVILDERDSKGKFKLVQLERKLRNVLDEMKIDVESDVFMQNAGSDYRKVRWLSGKESLTTTTYIVKLTTADQVSEFIAKLAENEISNVTINKLEYSKLKEVQKELRREAMLDAQLKAKELAAAIGQSAGKAIYILETNNYRDVNPVYYNRNAIMVTGYSRAQETDPITNVSFQQLRVTSGVLVRFCLDH